MFIRFAIGCLMLWLIACAPPCDARATAVSQSRPDARTDAIYLALGQGDNAKAAAASADLFARVAESTVILEPIRQVGCCSASATVACATRSRSQVRNGPPDAVSVTRHGELPCAVRHWSTALCSAPWRAADVRSR